MLTLLLSCKAISNALSYLQACHLQTETITYEEKEQQLVNDCVKELSMSRFIILYSVYVH